MSFDSSSSQKGPSILVSYNKALEAFSHGCLVAIPTETVYGLSAPINNVPLIKKIFEIKQRPSTNPLIVHVSNLEQAKQCFFSFSPMMEALGQHFWPGPLTLLNKKSSLINNLITAHSDLVAVRMPRHPLTLSFIEELKIPLVAPSANLFTKISPTKALDVLLELNNSDVWVLDGGPCEEGIESSIVEINDEKKLLMIQREGMITQKDLEIFLKKTALPYEIVLKQNKDKNILPGSFHQHYRPSSPFILYLYKGPFSKQKLSSMHVEHAIFQDQFLRIFSITDLEKLPASMYETLRQDSKKAFPNYFIWALPLLKEARRPPFWPAIIDRLKKASSLYLEDS